MIRIKSKMIFLTLLFSSILICLLASPPELDLTHKFLEEAKWFADNFELETRNDFLLRTQGVVHFADSKPLEVGDVEEFNTYNVETAKHTKIKATLKKIGTYCYLYLEEGQTLSKSTINKIVQEFDEFIYPETRSWFGSEWLKGVNDDPKITLLLLDIKDGYNPEKGKRAFTAGYFYPGDNYLKEKNPNSNERKMLYLDIFPSDPSSATFLSVIAHEFQHMIHWNKDPKEFIWLNESMSQLAQYLCGYGHPDQLKAYLKTPDNSLVAWSYNSMIANYGQVYLWAYYISTKISSTLPRRKAFIRRLVTQHSQGLKSINETIIKHRIKNDVRTLFKNFSVANYLNDDRIDGGVYGYDANLSGMFLPAHRKIDKPPFEGKASVKVWSSKAIQINPASFVGKKVKIQFSGQKVAASDHNNAFDVAVVTSAKNRVALPQVKWLKVKQSNVSESFEMPANHDRMLLVVTNRGPEESAVERSFALNSPDAKFSYAVRPLNSSQSAPVLSQSETSFSHSQTTTEAAMSILNDIISAPSIASINELMQCQVSESQKIEYDFRLQKNIAHQQNLIDLIKSQLAISDYELVEMVIQLWSDSNPTTKQKLTPLKNNLLDLIKFEKTQGNKELDALLYKLSEQE